MVKTFKLGAKTYKVKRQKELIQHPENPNWKAVGMVNTDTLEIFICENNDEGIPIHPMNQDQTFYHELVHAILNEMGHDLNNDEFFVQTFSNFLHQFITTKKESK